MLRDMFDDVRGSISVLSALTIVAVIGFSALALEFGHGLLQRVENQRIADVAAYGGALVYNSTGSSSSTSSAVGNIAALNGLSSTAANSSVVSSPTSDGNNAVKVTVTTNVPLYLAQLIRANTTMGVSATSYAEVNATAPGCIIALKGSGSGISLSGGTSITANNCAVASNNAVTLVGGTKITTKNLDYSTSYSVSGGSSIVPPSGTSSVTYSKSTTADPLSSNSEVSGATSRISTVSSITSPSGPSVSGGSNVVFGWSSTSMSIGSPTPCTAARVGSTWTVTCAGSTTYTFGNISLGGGITVNFNTGGSSSITYNFNGNIDGSSGTALSFGPGTYNVKGGIIAAGSLPMTFGAGAFNIGTTSCSGTSGYSICLSGSARLTFGGPSTFVLAGGIYQGASGMPPNAALSLGYGSSSNSFNIGKSSNGYSLNEANGATLFGDASGTGDLFQMAGSLTTSGGTCVAVSAAAEHDINGYINGAGGISLGSGIYTVNGYVALGNSGGGDVSNCPTSGTTTGLSAIGVTLVISGASTVSCGSTTSAFCLGAGYSTVKLTAPTSTSTLGSSTAGLAVIGPQSTSNTAAAAFTSGATNTQVSGAFYFPNGPVTMSGAATLHDTVDSGACLELIGSQVTLSGGSATGSTCAGLGTGSTGTTVSLVQ
jgi:hypothetical protein